MRFHGGTSWQVVLATAVAGLACGGQTSSGLSVRGTIGGAPIPTTDAVALITTQGANVTAEVALTNVAGTCGVVQREVAGGPEPSNTAVFFLSVEMMGTAVPPGTYTIPSSPGPAVSAGYATTDSRCATVTQDTATGGTVTFTTVDATTIAGTFDVMFGSDRVTGSFSAPVCTVTPKPGAGTPTCGP